MADIIQDIFEEIRNLPPVSDRSIKVKEFRNKIKEAGRGVGKRIVIVDPVGLQPIVARQSPVSKGAYKRFEINKIKLRLTPPRQDKTSIKKSSIEPKLPQKPCKDGKVRNPKTGRCVKQKIPGVNPKLLAKPCEPGKIRSLKTGRCIKTAELKKKDDIALFDKQQQNLIKKLKHYEEKREKKKMM